MTCRPVLWAHSVRNRVGVAMRSPRAYTDIQIGAAVTVKNRFLQVPGNTLLDAVTWVSDFDRECSLLLNQVGDKKQAFGAAQWHPARIEIILEHIRIDVRTAGWLDQCEAVIWETSQAPSAYRTIQARMQMQTTLENKIAVAVSGYEGSANQPRDIQTQLVKANYWLDYFTGAIK